MIKIVYGNLLDTSAKYICHQVNCQGVMGSGVAKQIRDRHPVVFQKYKEVCDRYSDKRHKLMGQICGVRIDENRAVINLFGQYEYGRAPKTYTDLPALKMACQEVANHVKPGDTIAMPYRIGCGLANGDWGQVLDMLTEVFREHHLTLYRI